ncbi:MAG: transposase [Bacteroidales bacterium]|nr:transposase [Bacteroidales bacterium]
MFIGRYEPSSKLCHVCGYKNDDLRLSDRTWVCPECGTVLDRDVNAAINIRNIAFERRNLIGVPSEIKHPSGSGAEDLETRGYAVDEASRLETLNTL